MEKKRLWLTYAWVDNEDSEVEFVAQELERAGLIVHYDKRRLRFGQRLWEQIGREITDPSRCDALAFYMTENSLRREPCKEELEYALGRALQARGEAFPIIGIVPGHLDSSLLPPSISSRLYVTLESPDWARQVKSGAEGDLPPRRRTEIPPIAVWLHRFPKQTYIEARPRAGRWYPVLVAVPQDEQSRVAAVLVGPSGGPPGGAMTLGSRSRAEGLAIWKLHHAATPTNSVYVCCNSLPSELIVGPAEPPQFVLDPSQLTGTP
jgi:hypothetical protein